MIGKWAPKKFQRIYLVIGLLVLMLLVMMFGFLHTDNQSTTGNIASIHTKNTAAISSDTVSSNNMPSTKSSNQSQSTQPDKALPIPAHQLKKILAEQHASDALDQKIAAVNQSITTIDKEIDKTRPLHRQ